MSDLKLKRILQFLIFLEGFLVMGIELSSSLIIKPFFGSSLEVWTFILGITMLSLACGYFLGAWLSRKENTLRIIYWLFALLSFAIFLIPFVSRAFFRTLLDYDVTTTLSLSVLPFLFPPLLLLGAVSTLIVKSFADNGMGASKSAALSYFISGIAGILSLFIVAFYLVENYSTYTIIYILALIPVIAVAVLHFALKTGKWFYPFAAFFGFLSIYYFSKGMDKIKDVFPNHIREEYNSDGLLGQVIVLKDLNAKTKMLLVNNTMQTGTDIEGRGNYYHVKKINEFLSLSGCKGPVLIAGLGGGSLVYELGRNKLEMDVVELDERMISVSKEHFLLPDSLNVHFFVDDARRIINTSSKKYQAIVLDLSIGESIPSNVYTLESFRRIKKMLKPDGILFINFFSMDTPDGLLSVKAIGNTLAQAGLKPKLMKRTPDPKNLSSFVFYAANSTRYKAMEDSLCMPFDYKNGALLTDDNSKLDLIHKDIILQQRKNYISSYQHYFQGL